MTIWPMFGISNQLLGTVALAIGTTFILRHAPKRAYALTTLLPFLFMFVTVMTSGVQFTQKILSGPHANLVNDYVKVGLTVAMMALAAIVCVDSVIKWRRILCGSCPPLPEREPEGDLMEQAKGIDVSD